MNRRYTPHPSNAEGPFYVVNTECMACGAPEATAPELIVHDDSFDHCYFRRQPETPDELNSALRYSGNDPVILTRLEVATIGIAMRLDEVLHNNPRFVDVRWFSATEDPDHDPGQPRSY
jgi:hypothetical protein